MALLRIQSRLPTHTDGGEFPGVTLYPTIADVIVQVKPDGAEEWEPLDHVEAVSFKTHEDGTIRACVRVISPEISIESEGVIEEATKRARAQLTTILGEQVDPDLRAAIESGGNVLEVHARYTRTTSPTEIQIGADLLELAHLERGQRLAIQAHAHFDALEDEGAITSITGHLPALKRLLGELVAYTGEKLDAARNPPPSTVDDSTFRSNSHRCINCGKWSRNGTAGCDHCDLEDQ